MRAPAVVVSFAPRTTASCVLISLCVLVCGPLALSGASPSDAPPPISALWQQPTDLSTRDLFVGEWGAERAPDPAAVYTFVRKKTRGSSPGVIVTDPSGRRWHVKQGEGSRAGGGPLSRPVGDRLSPAAGVLSEVVRASG